MKKRYLIAIFIIILIIAIFLEGVYYYYQPALNDTIEGVIGILS
jgi:uncharacterized protein YpmB